MKKLDEDQVFDIWKETETDNRFVFADALMEEMLRINGDVVKPQEQEQEINCGWCKSCGEGVTTFCRGRSETCAMGLKKILKV